MNNVSITYFRCPYFSPTIVHIQSNVRLDDFFFFCASCLHAISTISSIFIHKVLLMTQIDSCRCHCFWEATKIWMIRSRLALLLLAKSSIVPKTRCWNAMCASIKCRKKSNILFENLEMREFGVGINSI